MVMPKEVIELVNRQKLGFVATVNEDGTPNLSHKGTLTCWDTENLIFADIHSHHTVQNLQFNPAVEVNVVDPFTRMRYRFKGKGTIIKNDGQAAAYAKFYTAFGLKQVEERVKNFVLINVESFGVMYSPAYDMGATEDELKRKWKDYYNNL